MVERLELEKAYDKFWYFTKIMMLESKKWTLEDDNYKLAIYL